MRNLTESLVALAVLLVIAGAALTGGLGDLFTSPADKIEAEARYLEAVEAVEQAESERRLYDAAALAMRSDTLMSWALVAVLGLVVVALMAVAVAAAWLLRDHWQRDGERIRRKPTVTR
jgi:hypothetical protein